MYDYRMTIPILPATFLPNYAHFSLFSNSVEHDLHVIWIHSFSYSGFSLNFDTNVILKLEK